MSKPDPSSSNADGSARGDTVAEPARPVRSLDDSWALSGAMPVPEVAGVTDQAEGHGELPAPPMIPAATPSGPGSNQGAVASVVARAAALRALGAKTIQGFGPAPIQKKANAPSAPSPASPAALHELQAQRQEQAETFEAVTQATFDGGPASFEAETQAAYGDLEDPTRARAAAPPSENYDSSAPVRYQEPVSAPLYLDEPPATLRVSTGTSDHSVPEIDAGVSGSLPPPEQVAAFLDQSDPGYSSEGHHADGDEPYPESSAPYGQESGNYSEGGSEYGRGDSGFSEAPHPDEHDGRGAQAELGDSGIHDGAASMVGAPAAVAARRGYASESDARGEAEWFEPSGAQPRSDGHYGHTMPQDHSFTEPSRRSNRPPGPNRFIAPIAVFIAVSAVVFAGAYFFYYRGQPATPQTVAVSGTSVGAASGATDPSAAGASSAGGSDAATQAAGASGTTGTAGTTGSPGADGSGAAAGTPGADGAGAGGATTAGLVDVRFDSSPAGAMVMLVDREHGITTPVGTTPVRAALDPKGSYDAIFTLEGHPTKMVSLSGGKEPRIFADLTGATATPPGGEAGKATGTGATQVAAVDENAKAGNLGKPDKSDAKPDKSKDRKRPRPGRTGSGREPAEEEEEEEDGAVNAAAMGTITISAKPACEISINGKPTGKSTPLRELPLTAGIHKITFVNKTLGVNETIAVRVTPGKETKVTQDYTGQGE